MKKSSKIISIVLAVLMAASCFTGFTIFSASAADEETRVYFEVPTLESWGTTKTVFCHIYTVYGHQGEPLKVTSWASLSERCSKDKKTGLYYFDTSKLGTIEENADYALLFSTKDSDGNSHQTGNITFSKECLGDSVYVTGNMVENTENSELLDFEGAWRNHSDKYGAKAAITSKGNIVGKYFPVHQPKEQIVSQFLCSWAVINAAIITPEIVQADCEALGVEPIDVYNQYATDYAEQLADPVTYPNVAPLDTIATLLGVDPTTEPATTEPVTTEPVTTEPVTTEPVTTEPVTTEPVTTEPVTTEPVTTEPVTTEPVTTEPVTTVPATDPAPVYLYGDVDFDGKITIQDATMIQKYGLGIGVDEFEDYDQFALVYALSDVSGDGRVSILDVTYIQKYLAKLGYNTAKVGTAFGGLVAE